MSSETPHRTLGASTRKKAADEITPDEIQSRLIQTGFQLWNQARGTRNFPARRDLSPRLLGNLLRNTVLVRAIDGGRDFQFGIIGDAIVLAQGASHQGMTMTELDEVLPGSGTALRELYRAVAAAKTPVAYRGMLRRPADGRTLYRESLHLPLGSGDETVDHILSFLVYMSHPESPFH